MEWLWQRTVCTIAMGLIDMMSTIQCDNIRILWHSLHNPEVAVADPETSEREGGQKTWNISLPAQWPSFYDYVLQVRGAIAPCPWIRYWTLHYCSSANYRCIFKTITTLIYIIISVADPETSERGGAETWNITRRIRRPSFSLLIFTNKGGHGQFANPPGSATGL